MAINNDRSLLEQQILSNSGLKGKELENLKARLATLSEQQLQAELSKSLSGNNKGEWYTGVTLEHNESVVMRNNHDQTTYTDDNGNEITELKDGDDVVERTIKSTDDKGNVFETTVTFSGGRPLTQTKTKNGNTTETTTYKYNDDADVPFVTVETKKADQSKVMTNVLEIDENGNFAGEDFIDRQTTSMDGTTTHIFTVNNCVVEQQVKPNGKKINTIYKGDSIEDYDNKKLNRVYQKTEQNGEVHEVAYDGNGNTRTVVQNGESPSAIAKKFGVKKSSLRRLNPARGKNAITQVGADIVIPGEYNADARVMTRRKSKQGAMQDFANDEVQRTAQRLYSSTMQEVTLDKDYKDAYSYARALLAADGVKNPSNQQINNKANEILVANGNIKFKKGTKVQITAKAPDSKFVQDLSNNGFKPTRENAIFYNRFNALNSQQQQNVLSVIKYCRSQKITDPNKIKARILETFPEINLFDSGKVIPMNSSFGTPAFQRKNPVALETFLTETLKLDLKSDVGRQVYERLASLPQEELGKINGSNFGDLSKSNFNDIANRFESSGVNIRTQFENQIEQNSRAHRAKKLGIPQQKFTSEMLANIYDRAADMMEEYYHNHGVFDAGTYLEGLKNITDWITPDNLFGIDMRSTLHVASDCRKAAQRFRQMHTDNPETFKREYEQLKKDGLVTADYNQKNVQEFMNLIQSGEVDINSDKFKNACQKAFGFKGVENTEKYIQTGEMAGNIGDIAVMLYTLGAASELKMMGKATTGVYGALERGAGKFMGKTAAQKTAKVGTSMLMGGTTLGGFTLGKETLNNLSNPMRDATSWETWKQTGIASAESFGFGAFGGLLNETVVAPIVKAIEKPATKATQAVSKALTEHGELTGKQIMQTVSESGGLKLDGLFKMNSQEWANLARTATAKGVGFGVEVTGFTAYEAGLDVIKDLIDPKTGRLPDNITVESLTKYLGEKFGEQFSNLGTIKGISQLLMMSKGGKVAQKAMMNEILSKSDALKDIKFKKAEINGHEVYEVTYPNGNRAVVSSPEQAIATCQMAMQMEFLAKSLTDGETKSETTEPQRFKTEVKAPEIKPEGTEENPLLTRLEIANDRESFVAIRDEIKKMPNGEEKTQLMQAYLKKYNEWSLDSSRPDIRMEYIPENETINLDIKKVQETLNILSQKKGLKDIKDEVKNEIAKLVGNSLPENQDQMIKLIYKLKNAKEWWGEKTQEYNDEQLLQIIKTASNPDDSLNLIVLQRICRRMDGGPREDNSNMTRILPMDTKEHNLARRSDGFYDEGLVEIGKKLMYAHQTREEIFKLLKDENGNPIKDLVELVQTDKSDSFHEGDMILGVLKALYTDGKLNLNKVGQMKELVKDGSVSIYRAVHTMQSDMPADIVQNIGVFTQKDLTNNEVISVINYLKSQNIEPTFESVKNTIENCGNIPELRDIHVKQLLNQRGESIDNSYYEYVKKIAQHIEQIKQVNPEKANQFPIDIVANYIKLLQIDGRSVQLKQHEIIELLYDRSKDTCPFDIDKLVDSGLLSDIPGRDKPLLLRDLMRYQKEDTEVLKNAINRGFLGGDYSKILSLREVPSGVITSGGGKSKLEQLVKLSDTELQFLQSMDTSDMLFGTAVGLAKCNPEQVKFLLETMNTHGCRYFANNYLRDSNFDLAYKMFKEIDAKMENHTTELTPQIACRILHFVNSENKYDAQNLFDNRQELGISADKIPSMLENKITKKQIQKAIKVMGKSKVAKLSNSDFVIACQFSDLYDKKNINEIPLRNKRDLLRSLVSSNRGLFEISEELSKDFPLLPKNQEEYCSLLPSIVRSLGIETNELTPEQRITMFNSSMGNLSQSLSKISDTDFAKMTISQEYPKDKFILDVLDKVKDLSRTERQKVYDYFGFELHHNKENSTGFSITGYPVNLNNGKKLALIEDPRTKAVVEELRPNVVRFSENNRIKCDNPQVEQFLNEVIEALPELRTTIGKKQHGAQAFDVMQHSLKVMQKITQDSRFKTLNESDQKIILLASLMHDITKAEGKIDKTHADYGSFDSFFIAQKFNLTKEEEVKLHTLIKHHEWLEQVNTAKSEEQLKKRLQSVAYDLQQGNLFDMAEIFTHADLRAVRADDSFHDTTEGNSRIGFDGTVRSFGESANVYAERIRGYIKELQKSQPLLPQTKVPRASRINEAITQVNPDGSTNIKGVYKDKDGLVVIKFNEAEDWEAIGFPKGSISHGIEIQKGEKGDAELSEDVNTGNIKFFVHGLNYSNQLAKFDAFSLVDSDALLSVSYAERPESKFRFFRPQGVLLDVNSKYIHGGGNTDSGSGCGKDIAEFKKNYIFGGHREYDRLYVSDLIKKTTGMTDEQYVEFVEINKDKPIQEIEPAEIRDKIIKAFATINSNTRKGKREYNEMYISNPNEVMGVFAYSIDYTEKIDNPVEFLNRNTVGEHEESYGGAGNISVKERTEFLRQYALERNLPFIIFGD